MMGWPDERAGKAEPGGTRRVCACLTARKPLANHHLSTVGALHLALIAALLATIAGELATAETGSLEQALAAIQDHMARSPAPWPGAWRQEYVDTIRQAIYSHPDAPQGAVRLDILRRGFEPYWEDLKKTQDRSLFEVHRAQIRWYVEHLMEAELPGEEESQALRSQYSEFSAYAASSLLTQFSFLDPNAVRKAQADDLAGCCRNIDAPLLPIVLEPFSVSQMDQIKQRWHDLRYARLDLWQQLGGDSTTPVGTRDAQPLNERPDYLLTQRSLNQLRAHIWLIVATPPDYYRCALNDRMNVQKQRLQSRSQAWAEERRLEKERSRQFLQTEQISFLLAALLETAKHFDEPPPTKAQVETPSEQPDHYRRENP